MIIMNLVSIILGLISFVMAIVGCIPFLGWFNWITLFIAGLGIILGSFSKNKVGRNICIVVFIIALFRLHMGGGII